jgi:hypothetical protein
MKRLLLLLIAAALSACAGSTPNLRPLPPMGKGGAVHGGVHAAGLLPNPQFGASLGFQAAPAGFFWLDGGGYAQIGPRVIDGTSRPNTIDAGGDLGARLVLRTPVLDVGLALRVNAATLPQHALTNIDGGAGLYLGLGLGPVHLALQPTVGGGVQLVGVGPQPIGVIRLPVALSLDLGPLRLIAEMGAYLEAPLNNFAVPTASPHAAIGLAWNFGGDKPKPKPQRLPPVRSSGTPAAGSGSY